MKLKRLAIQRLPGINEPFAIEAAGAGVHVVVGPNGIGKSSLCRAVEGLYWADLGATQRTTVNGEFELAGEAWWAERKGARVRWQRGGEDSAPPSLPTYHNHRHFFLRLRDLIDPAADGTQDIAAEIRRQMAGGFDLDRIGSELFGTVGKQHGRRERRDFDAVQRDVQEAAADQARLQQRADALATLRAQLETARTAGRRLTSVERALGLAARRQEQAAKATEIATLPDTMAKLSGDEDKRIKQLNEQIDGYNVRARALEGQCNAARSAKQNTGLTAPLDAAELAVCRDNANALARLEPELEAARDNRRECLAEVAGSLKALGGGDVEEVDLALPDNRELFEFLRDAEGHKAEARAIEEQLGVLAYVEQPVAGQAGLDDTRHAVDALRAWLRAPGPQTPAMPFRAVALFAAFAVVIGLGLAMLVEPLLSALAAFGAGLGAAALLWGRGRAHGGAREAAQRDLAALGIAAPEAWETASVDARLRALESDISRLERARDRDVERQKLNSQLAALSERAQAIEARRQAVAERLRLDRIPPDAELVDTARTLGQLAAARGDEAHARSKVESLEARYAALLSGLTDYFARYGVEPPESTAEATARLDALVERDRQLVQALSEERSTTDGLKQVLADRGAALAATTQLYATLGLGDGDLPGLARLLDLLPDYQKLTFDAAKLKHQIELDREELTKADEAELTECELPALERMQDELSRIAAEEASLRNEIAKIEHAEGEAKRGLRLQALMARQDEARATLQDRRDEALFAHAGQFLIDAVETEYEQTQMPRVFESARDHLSAFTHHGYELRLGKEAMFAIEQRSGEGRQLEELSDGTRAQLLLAARIAFAEEVEQGKTLPLFLDEALDQSDPDRFNAIMRSLGQLAKDQDRQIFYLTSDPVDVERIRQALAAEGCDIAATIDLGLIRRKAASIDDAGALRVEPRPEVPLPGDMAAADYGVALGVPAFSPQAGHEPQHVFYLMPDALEQLRGFLVAGIERAGQWRTASNTVLATKLCAGALPAEEMTARGDLLEHFCALWKQGRGRPVDRDALEHSGAVSNTFIDKVAAVTDDLGGNAESLLAALDDKKDARLKGFRRNSQESLEAYLQSEGYLDDRPVLSESELRLQAMATPAANALPNGTAADLLHGWWAWATRVSGG